MTLKTRFTVWYGLLFSVILGFALAFVYISYSQFRKEEFKMRLTAACKTTTHLFSDVDEIDAHLLKLIDKNTTQTLYNQEVFIFDSAFNVLYASQDQTHTKYSKASLKKALQKNEVFVSDEDFELIILKIVDKGKTYLCQASAYDIWGFRKLEFLKYSLLAIYLFSILITWITTYLTIRQSLRPIDIFKNKIQEITESNLTNRVILEHKRDEITELAEYFNQLISRLEKSFEFQKNFIHHASHELKTPIAILIAETEHALITCKTEEDFRKQLQIILEDQRQAADLLSTLLAVAKFDRVDYQQEFNLVRVDDVVFKVTEAFNRLHEDFKPEVDFKSMPESDDDLSFLCNEGLVIMAISNLVKNAYYYSEDKTCRIEIDFDSSSISLKIQNSGARIQESEMPNIFDPFTRGKNSQTTKGSGLGLTMIQRVAILHKGKIEYTFEDNLNTFKLTFPKV